MKKILCLLLTVILTVLCIVPALSATAAESDETVPLIEGTYAPNQVVVLFKSAAINTSTAPRTRDLAAVGEDFGEMMDASSSQDTAYAAADEELGILKKSLGSDFVLEDTLVFDGIGDNGALASTGASPNAASDGLSIALVSSDKYDTATLIEKLKTNPNVVKAEPNYYISPASMDSYSLNDPLNSYLYQVNSPAANNTGGEKVDDRGTDPETALSVNAASGWKKLSGNQKEVVVAVVDTGVLYTHEDLKDMMWTNPGNIGLKGTYGYDFCNNDDDPIDDNGHGTHCAGVIAAQANNEKGIAGIASAAKVKIMALKILNEDGGDGSTIYSAYGAYNYIHKAVQGGVNVVASSNSWGSWHYGTIYDDLYNILGEDGVLTIAAAANFASDNDRISMCPANSESDYEVAVGAADITGTPAGFSNYGKTSVDVFGPGMNILSGVGYQTYFPSIESAEKLNATTEYYGEFSAATEPKNGTVIPTVGTKAGPKVSPFGGLKFVKQVNPDAEYDDDDEDDDDDDDDDAASEIPDTARLSLSVEKGRHFTSGNPYRLKITIEEAQYGEEYYIYFPYKKNAKTTSDNTYFSIVTECVKSENGVTGVFYGGEVYRDEDDSMVMAYEGDYAGDTTAEDDNMVQHITNAESELLIGADDAEGMETGIGLCFKCPEQNPDESNSYSIYLESIAVSKPDIELDADTSYDVMSGTSMATPAVAGASALLSAAYPKQKGETGAAYAKRIRAKLFSCVRQTAELENLCSTGGYVDLSLLDAGVPAIADAVCDVDKETITLTGENLYAGSTLTYLRLADSEAEESPLPAGMTVNYAADGTELTICNAKSLFSTYTAFTVKAKNGTKGTGKFFLVKGQKKLRTVASHMEDSNNGVTPPYLLTDAAGRNLYGYTDKNNVCYFESGQFVTFSDSNPEESLRKHLVKNGEDTYTVYNDYQITPFRVDAPLNENGVIYAITGVYLRNQNAESDDDEYGSLTCIGYYLGSFDLNEKNPSWRFSKMADLPDALVYQGDIYMTQTICDGKIYCIGYDYSDSEVFDRPMYSYTISTGKWKKEAALPCLYDTFDFFASNGKLYVMFCIYNEITLKNEDKVKSNVYCYNGKKWERKDDMDYVGRYSEIFSGLFISHSSAIAQTKNGLIVIGSSVDGGGNAFLYHTDTDRIEPLYYTVSDSLCDSQDVYNSCVTTRDGVYYIYQCMDEYKMGWKLCLLPAESGAYESPFTDGILGDADGDGYVTILDATAIQRVIADLPVSSYHEKLADVDGDGTVTIVDVTAIQRFVAELPTQAQGIGEPK